MTTTTDVSAIAPIGHDEAMAITRVEHERFTSLLASIHGDDWTRRTDCDRWDVRGVVCHVIGAAEMVASLREAFHQMRVGRPLTGEIGGTFWIDGVNELQVRERREVSDEELARRWQHASSKALRRRTRLPAIIRNRRVLDLPAPVGKTTIAYLSDIGLTRDVWMHRVDISEGLGLEMEVDAEHDGRLVADLVAEWAHTHGEAFDLTLTGPAGAHFVSGDGGEMRTLDVVMFCRIISGRRPGTGVLAHPLPL